MGGGQGRRDNWFLLKVCTLVGVYPGASFASGNQSGGGGGGGGTENIFTHARENNYNITYLHDLHVLVEQEGRIFLSQMFRLIYVLLCEIRTRTGSRDPGEKSRKLPDESVLEKTKMKIYSCFNSIKFGKCLGLY